MNNNLLLDDQC